MDTETPRIDLPPRRALWRAFVPLVLVAALAGAFTLAPSRALANTVPLAESAEETRTLTIPERMANTYGARQLVVITGEAVGSRSGTLRLFEHQNGRWVEIMSANARFGSKGLMNGEKRRAGNKTTPTGIWKMPSFAFGAGKNAPKGTTLKWRRITRKSYWSDKKGKTYNKWVTSSRRRSGERLVNYKKPYRYAISTGYNASPNRSVYGRGSCIFIHVKTKSQTAGCVSIPSASMRRLVIELDPKLNPYCVIGTTSNPFSPTYLYSY